MINKQLVFDFLRYLSNNTIIGKVVPRRIKILLFNFFRKKIGRSPLEYLRFGIALTTHCNLNCAGCASFSPIAEEEYMDTGSYEQDCKRIYELTNGKVEYIGLAGGEPTLHPNLLDFINITRKYFEDAEIQLITNGLFLNKKDNKFWEACKKNNIIILISKYPIKINMDEILEKGKLYDIVVKITESKTDEMFHFKLDIEGKQDVEESFDNCFMSEDCTHLSEGRLYPCGIIYCIKNFNRYFNMELKPCENDSIDIYKAKDINEILEFLNKPVSFCRYCDIKQISYMNKWHISKKDIKEWT